MLKMDVKFDMERVERQLTQVQRQEVPKAASRALNRAITTANTQAARKISQESGIKPQRKIRDQLRIVKASWQRLEAMLTARGHAFNLIQFVTPAKRHRGAFRNKPGVVAKAWGQRKTYRGTFIVRGRNSGKPVVVSRKPGRNKGRGWSDTKHGPSVPIELQRRRVQELLDHEARRTFRREFMRDLRRRLDRLNRKR